MVDWEVTATTIYCDDVADEVTIIVSRDGATRCSGMQKYLKPSKETARELKTKGRHSGKLLSCKGDTCPTIPRYRAELMQKP